MITDIRNALFCAIALATLATGCATQPFDLDAASRGTSLKPVVIETTDFNVQTLQPQSVTGTRLRVYIEGDGHAWVTSRRPSDDPTPVNSMMANFALEDPASAVYMARPCQFVTSAKCSQAYWTDARFAVEIVRAQSEALDILKSRLGVRQFELVGYSGGAAMALLLAAQRADVLSVQTIAGNLDHSAWTATMKLAPLQRSLNPIDHAEILSRLPQRHYIGLHDRIMPRRVLQHYLGIVRPKCVSVVEVDANHYEGFLHTWMEMNSRLIACSAE